MIEKFNVKFEYEIEQKRIFVTFFFLCSFLHKSGQDLAIKKISMSRLKLDAFVLCNPPIYLKQNLTIIIGVQNEFFLCTSGVHNVRLNKV